MKVIGIVGGIASGKSLVTQMLSELGACVLDADRTGHQVLEEEAVRRQLHEHWGDGIFTVDGRVDRSALAAIVFAKTPAAARDLARLENITHPRIRARLSDQIDEYRRQGAPAVVLDAPVLVKAGWHKLCDRIIFVDAPHSVRVSRASQRGWTEAELNAREEAQTPLDSKRELSDFVVDNSRSRDHTQTQVERVWRAIRAE